jgi:hypothetical protein
MVGCSSFVQKKIVTVIEVPRLGRLPVFCPTRRGVAINAGPSGNVDTRSNAIQKKKKKNRKPPFKAGASKPSKFQKSRLTRLS